MKHDTFEKYAASNLDLPQRALLTAWDCLAAYQGDLVLVGGMAIHHLTHPPQIGMVGPVTLDVDFGIRIAASSGMYGSIRESLSAHGFEWMNAEKRFLRKFPDLDLYIDLLTDDGKSDMGTAFVDDGLAVGTLPGIDRALEVKRLVKISGKTSVGADATQSIAVAEVGPMLALKLNAFGGPAGRKTPKDAHDILYLATEYVDGPDLAIQAFHTERKAGNRAVPHAISALEHYFEDENAEGPMACAAFRLNNRHEKREFEGESILIRQQCVTLAQALLH